MRTKLAAGALFMVLGVVAMAAAPPAAAPAPGPAEPTDASLRRQARDAAEAGQWNEALEHWDQLRRRHPELAQLPYNMGVAAHRLGDLERAAQLFRDAATVASDPALRARSAYNLGTTEFQRAAAAGNDPDAAAAAAGGLDDASRRVGEALEQFRDALDQDPEDVDARANGELAQQLLERLEQLKQQLQQPQQGDQQQDQQDQQDQNQQQRESPDMQQQQQQGGQQDQPRQGSQGQDQNQGQSQQQQQESQGSQREPKERKDQQDRQNPQPEGETEPAEAAPESGQQSSGEAAAAGEETEGDRKPMSRQEAERLLQGVRDKERKRRDDEARRMKATKPRVEKDW